MMDPQLQQLLEEHSQFLTVLDNGKVCCKLNNHHFPARFDVVNAFVSGSKYAKLLKRHQDAGYLKSLEPYLVPSINYQDKLFCALTCQLLTATAEAAATHMQGKRFKRHKEMYDAKELELFVEPLLPADNMEEEEEGDAITAGHNSRHEETEPEHPSTNGDDAMEDVDPAVAIFEEHLHTNHAPVKGKKAVKAKKAQQNAPEVEHMVLPPTPNVGRAKKRNPTRPPLAKRARG